MCILTYINMYIIIYMYRYRYRCPYLDTYIQSQSNFRLVSNDPSTCIRKRTPE